MCYYIDYGNGGLVSLLALILGLDHKSAVSSELSLKTGWHQAELRGLQGTHTAQPHTSRSNWCGTNFTFPLVFMKWIRFDHRLLQHTLMFKYLGVEFPLQAYCGGNVMGKTKVLGRHTWLPLHCTPGFWHRAQTVTMRGSGNKRLIYWTCAGTEPASLYSPSVDYQTLLDVSCVRVRKQGSMILCLAECICLDIELNVLIMQTIP